MSERTERHKHLALTRAEPTNPRRTRGGGARLKPPPDPSLHGKTLLRALDETVRQPVEEPGFDPRLLLKLEIEGVDPEELRSIEGLDVVSQEGKTIVVLFASLEGRRRFRSRLDLLSRGGQPTRRDILFAIQGVSTWSAGDRIGPALRAEGVPDAPSFVLDVELWPLDRARGAMLDAFVRWCQQAGVEIIDRVDQDAIVLYRLRLSRSSYDRLLQHRDVRLVDLPPRMTLTDSELQVPIGDLPPIEAPPPNAPKVAVLDSGVATNQPLLASAIGDAQSFLPGHGAQDEHGHGTAVAGIALYGDVHHCMIHKSFVPRLRILSGRIIDNNAENSSGFVENHLANAVTDFTRDYQCKIFNLSFGDARKPYSDGHVRGLAVTLDTLSRSHGVLFIVSAGNYTGAELDQEPKWKTEYPRYLLDRSAARILDPAPALNALTVGSLARFELPRSAQRYPNDPAYQPAARTDQPSPFTRSGPGPGAALKPEVVAYGGNYAVDLRAGEARQLNALLGEPAPSHDFATSGRLLRDFSGTSFAAPNIAHLAARLLGEYPNASANALRALIVAHARIPAAAEGIVDDDELRRLVGYGRPDLERCVYSLDNCVSLFAEEKIEEEQHHFYDIPLPGDFLDPVSRDRTITVALAHTPIVRTTRFDYRGSRMDFRLVSEASLDAVSRVFQRTPKGSREEMLTEFRPPSVGSRIRDKSTVQAATYEVKRLAPNDRKKKLFVVVTRSVPKWARGWAPKDPYALVVILEDRSDQRVRYYQQIVEIQLQQRVRVRT